MQIEIEVIGQTDKMIRFNLLIDDVSAGELMTERAVFTKLVERLFEKQGYVIKSKTTPHETTPEKTN